MSLQPLRQNFDAALWRTSVHYFKRVSARLSVSSENIGLRCDRRRTGLCADQNPEFKRGDPSYVLY